MYPVTDLYKEMINKDGREFTCNITIEHSQGTLKLTDEDLSMGSLTYTEATQSGDEYTIGSTVASDISFTIFKKPEYENIQFMGATVFATIGLLTLEGTDAHFIQPSQPSKMQGFEDVWEYVPLGRFNIDVVDKSDSTIQIKAIDNMINFDKPYTLSNLTYPATLQQIYVNICNVADIPMSTVEFPNMNYLVSNKPSDDLTLRDILGYVAELSGTFAKCTRTGSVELRWYKPSDLKLTPEHRYDFTPSDDVVQITGVLATVKGEEEEDDVTYITGSEGYTIDLTENALLQGDYENVLPNIYNNVKDTIFTPYSSNSKGNPAIQAGDIIKQIDKNGKEYTTIITKSVYKYRGKSSIEGSGLPQISKGYKGSTNRKLAEIKHKVDVEIGDKLTDLEQDMLNATELITGQLGGYVLKRKNELLIMDNPNPNLAVKVWRWNLGGLGYSSSGVDGIYETAMTMDGSINAKFITTGSLSANRVQSGLLESQNGNSSINLDNGTISLGSDDNNPLLYFNGSNNLTFGSGVSLSWGQITNRPSIPSVPSYIKSTYIDSVSIESPSITGGTVTGGIIRTSQSGRRVQMDSDGIESYNTSNRLQGFKLSTYGELELYNAGTEIGGIRYDTSGAGTTEEAKNRMFITTMRNYAMKLQSSGNMSLQAPTIYLQGNINADNRILARDGITIQGNVSLNTTAINSLANNFIRAISSARAGMLEVWDTGINVYDSDGVFKGLIKYDD